MYRKIYTLPFFLLLLVSCKKADNATTVNTSDTTNVATSSDPLPKVN